MNDCLLHLSNTSHTNNKKTEMSLDVSMEINAMNSTAGSIDIQYRAH